MSLRILKVLFIKILNDIKPGGLGTFFINHIMDEFFFEKNNAHDWVNHLVLKKKIN